MIHFPLLFAKVFKQGPFPNGLRESVQGVPEKGGGDLGRGLLYSETILFLFDTLGNDLQPIGCFPLQDRCHQPHVWKGPCKSLCLYPFRGAQTVRFHTLGVYPNIVSRTGNPIKVGCLATDARSNVPFSKKKGRRWGLAHHREH
jgi:hypothetical protein